MQKKKTGGKIILATKTLVFMALMIALSIVLGKFLAVNVTTMIRISLENLPILLAAIVLGPYKGALVALTADLLGCLLRGYEINPIVTIGCVTLAFLSGVIYRDILMSPRKKLILSVGVGHLVGSVLIKTFGLASFYLSSYNMGFATLLGIRFVTYVLTLTLEIAIILFLLKSKAIRNQIAKFRR
jgi:ECF transporter S component (folate family)